MTAALPPLTGSDLETLAQLARQLRVDSIRASTSAGSGHPTSSMSAADVLAVLVARHLRYDWDQPGADGNDHLIFSKGHASPLLYSLYKAVGVVSDDELMTGYRRFGSRLQGHPTPVLPWVDVATGSLGQGLPDGVGVALAGKYLDRVPFRVWVLCGDSELAEGSIWEALDKAAHYELSNLVAIVDVNRLGQRGPTELGWDLDAYARRAEAFGARVLRDRRARLDRCGRGVWRTRRGSEDRPTVILARTIKGRGFSEVEDREGWHGKPFPGGHGGASDRRAWRGEQPAGARTVARSEAVTGVTPASRDGPGHLAAELRARREGRNPPGLRRSPEGARRPPSAGGRAGWRGEQLHPRRPVRARPIRTATSRCSSPSSSSWRRPSG